MRVRVSWVTLRMRRCRIPKRAALLAVIIIHTINILLRTTAFLQYYCETECDLQLWSVPFPPEDKLIISHLRKNVLDPHQDEVEEPLTEKDYDNQPWAEVGQWDLIQQVIRDTLANVKNGVFVEVGAGNGVFLSHTSWLESAMGWSGLLVEPRRSSYSALRRRRKAMAANVCVSDISFNHKDMLWQPKNTEDMPPMYREVTEGKSTLLRYVAMEDRELGEVNSTQCFTLDSLLIAAGLSPPKRIDLMVLHTMGGEGMIIDTLEKANLMMLAVRNRGGVDQRYIMYAAERLGMALFEDVPHEIDNFLFFLSKKVDIVKKLRTEGEAT